MEKIQNPSEIDLTLTAVRPFQYRNRDTVFAFGQKCRPDYALTFQRSGSITYHIGEEVFRLEKGDILLLKVGDAYLAQNSEAQGVPYEFYTVSFSIAENEIPKLERVTHVRHFEKFLDLFEKGWKLSGEMGVAYRLAEKSIISEIFCNLYKEQDSAKERSPSFTCMENARQYIDRNYKQKLSVEEIAAVSGFSRSHFKRLFQQYYGMTPGEYLTNVRINRAKFLLESKLFYLGEIAAECGFSDEYYFSRVFQKVVGCPPKQY